MSEHELWNELGNVYFLFGTYDQAVHAYNRAIALSPETGEPYSNLALTYVQMGRYSEASEVYRRGVNLLKDELDKAVSLHKLGDVYLHLKQFSEAVKTYQQTEELVPDLGQIVEASKPVDLLLHCQPSDSRSQQQQIASAGDVISVSALEKELPPLIEELTPWWFDGQAEPEDEPEPGCDFGFISENTVYTEPLIWELAMTSHTALTNQDAETVSVFDSEVEAANAVDLNTSITRLPEAVSMLTAQGAAGISYEKLVTDVNTCVTAPEPVPVPVMVVINDSKTITESPEFLVQNITAPEVVQYETPDELPVVELSQSERLEIQTSINKFKRTLELNPRNAMAWDTLGGNYKALGQYDDAINAFQKAVSLDSSKAFYFHHLGLVYAAVGRYDDAIDAFERVIAIDPNHSLAHATLGGYYRKQGNEELAKEHIEKAMSLLPEDENEYNRACMEAICGNTDRSLELLELALKNKQTYVNWAHKDPDLDFIRSDPRFNALLGEFAAKTA
jgi:tetratricopeptide (TPR) repeat protein